MAHRQLLKSTLKRGALIAAANWPVALVQATADSLFKLLIAVPIIGGIFLVALVLGTAPDALLTLDWREMAATTVGALLSHPIVLTAFLLAVAVVGVGGSLFVYLVKAGTVAVLVTSEREAEPVEDAPVHVDSLARTSRFSIELFIASAQRLFPRYARLGLILMAVYLASAVGYFVLVTASRSAGEGWGVTALLSALFVCWITMVNLLYLLTQIVIAADGRSVASAARRVLLFLRHERRKVARVFLVVLVLVIGATGASLVATALLSLIAFVPFVGLAVLPLQLIAWVLRALVLQYIGLTSVGAYIHLYRRFAGEFAEGRIHDRLRQVPVPHGAPAP
jgi:hypothetical protein